MISNKQQAAYKHVLVFVKPKFSRDKGIIRLCRNDPENRFKLKTIQSVDDYINNEQYQYERNKKKENKNGEKGVIYHGIIPIMYLSEWKSATEDYKKFFSQ